MLATPSPQPPPSCPTSSTFTIDLPCSEWFNYTICVLFSYFTKPHAAIPCKQLLFTFPEHPPQQNSIPLPSTGRPRQQRERTKCRYAGPPEVGGEGMTRRSDGGKDKGKDEGSMQRRYTPGHNAIPIPGGGTFQKLSHLGFCYSAPKKTLSDVVSLLGRKKKVYFVEEKKKNANPPCPCTNAWSTFWEIDMKKRHGGCPTREKRLEAP